MMNALKIDGVRKHYGNTPVLEDVSFEVGHGELVSLLGPSGCGKSTLLRAIAGLIPLDQGEIWIGEREVSRLAPKDREVGMVFQSYALFPNLTVFENIAFGLRVKRIKEAEIKKRVADLISLVHLEGKEGFYPRQLSGGQQQRVALARSLAVQPKVLLLDEPFSALDAKIRKNLQEELRALQQALHITTILVTHDQEEALSISDRLFVMEQGRILQAGTPEEIYAAPAHPFVAHFIGQYNILSRLEAMRLMGREVEGTRFVIRPEVIRIQAEGKETDGSGRLIAGIVRRSTMMGNILRYSIEAEGVLLLVDQLHRRANAFKVGSQVFLSIPQEEFIVLQ